MLMSSFISTYKVISLLTVLLLMVTMFKAMKGINIVAWHPIYDIGLGLRNDI